jgi:hypothetical protein
MESLYGIVINTKQNTVISLRGQYRSTRRGGAKDTVMKMRKKEELVEWNELENMMREKE